MNEAQSFTTWGARLRPMQAADVEAVLAIEKRNFREPGTTRAFGYLEARPAIVLHRTVTLDGFIGDALTSDGAQVFYGGGVTVNFAPSWAICPFLGIAG